MPTTRVSEIDPRDGLRGAAALKRLAESVEELLVVHARAAGLSWEEIAEELDVSKQVVHRKYQGKLFTQGRADV